MLNEYKTAILIDTKRCVCSNKSCIRSFAGCADLNLEGLCWVSCRKFSEAIMMVMTNQWSVEFTCHILVTVRIAWNFGRGGTKKVPGTVPSGKPCKSEPY